MTARTINLIMTTVVALIVNGCGDNTEPPGIDASVVALPPHETPPDGCLGPDCPSVGSGDAGLDDAVATYPPFPSPAPCDTCVGFSCEAVCTDAGTDAP